VAFDEGFRALHLGRSSRRFRRGTDLTQAELAHHKALILHHPVLLGDGADLGEIREALLKVRIHADLLRSRQAP
jgi:hypothetical protein